jgi:L-iditol 2-dehydrogenase
MLAACLEQPGIVEVKEVEKPKVKEGEVLLKIDACALCGTDKRVLAGEKPVSVPIVGHEIVGRVEELGDNVDSIKIGQRVSVQTVIGCGECSPCKENRQNLCEKGFTAIGYAYNGGFADYMIMPKKGVDQNCLIKIPDDLETGVATLLEPLSCCINGLRTIPLEKIEHIVIMGAGVIGILNALVAKARGVKRVTVMNRSVGRLELAEKLGLPIDDYVCTKDIDPVQWVKENSEIGEGVGAVIICASTTDLAAPAIEMLKRDGHLSLFAGMPKSNPTTMIDLNLIHYRELHLHGANSSVRVDYEDALEMLVSKKIDWSPLITHRFALRDFKKAIKAQNAEGSLKLIVEPHN